MRGCSQWLRVRRALSPALMAMLALVGVLVPALWAPAGAANIIVTDLHGKSFELLSLPSGHKTLLFICDPTVTTCREGAVHFDSQASRIRERGIEPLCIMVSDLDTAKQAATNLALAVPVYVDAYHMTPEELLGQEILPAMVLLDGKGRVIKVTVGGGESLDSNLTKMLEGGGHKLLALSVLIPLGILGIILLIG